MGLRPPLKFAMADAAWKVGVSSAHRVRNFTDPEHRPFAQRILLATG